MPDHQVLLVCDGSEMVRQRHADAIRFFQETLRTGPFEARPVKVRFVHEDGVDAELAGIVPTEYQCVIFASNALLRPDGGIARACRQRAADLRAYLERGGSLLVLHQSLGNQPHPLLEGALPDTVTTTPRVAFETNWSLEWSPGSPFMVHPNAIVSEVYRESAPGLWQNGFPLCYQTLSVSGDTAGWRVVASTDEGPVILCHEGRGGRSIVSALPLDWAREVNLLQNILQYAIDGLPTVVIVSDNDPTPSLRLDLARLAAQYPTLTVLDRKMLDRLPAAVTSSVQLIIDLGPAGANCTSFDRVLARGGQLIRPKDSAVHGANTTFAAETEMGPRYAVSLAQVAILDAAAVSVPTFCKDSPLFDTRDLMLSLDAIFDTVGRPGRYVTLEVVQSLEARCRRWLDLGQAEVDQYTALVCISLGLFCRDFGGSTDLAAYLLHHLSALPTQSSPEGLFLQTILRCELTSDSGGVDAAWSRLEHTVDESRPSVAGVVRILDAARVANTMLGASPSMPGIPAGLAQACARALTEAGGSQSWISIEATASIVAGLANAARSENSEFVLEALRIGVEPLVRFLTMETEHALPLARLQVASALIQLERSYASGLRDLSTALLRQSETTRSEFRVVMQRNDLLQDSESRVGSLLQANQQLQGQLVTILGSIGKHDRAAIWIGRAFFSMALVTTVVLGLSPLLSATASAITGGGVSAYSHHDYSLLTILPAAPFLAALGRRYRLLLLPDRMQPASSLVFQPSGETPTH